VPAFDRSVAIVPAVIIAAFMGKKGSEFIDLEPGRSFFAVKFAVVLWLVYRRPRQNGPFVIRVAAIARDRDHRVISGLNAYCLAMLSGRK